MERESAIPRQHRPVRPLFHRSSSTLASMRAALVLIVLNGILFLVKAMVGVRYDSLAILSDAGNSLIDIITSVIILIAVRETGKPADKEHPFGHARIEPMAAFTVAVLTCMLATEVGREAVGRLLTGSTPQSDLIPILVLLGVILIKGAIWRVAGKMGRRLGSAALTAAAVDAQMDVVISLMALLGVAGVSFGLPWLDGAASLLIAFWIAWVGYRLGRDNIERLIGHLPDAKTVRLIRARLDLMKKTGKILNFHELRIHYVGSEIHIAVHVDMDQRLGIHRSHDLDEEIQAALTGVPGVTHVAVHMDPISLHRTASVPF
ncbi:MAG: cation transporter [Magnetococcales bacterium]|nr:cation transporter [Magnetococcales bacterium]NGZ05294.1 cation transporter [Magnetococcales bacterium]